MAGIEDEIDKLIKEESAQAKAVSSLIEVKPKTDKKVLGSDIELKTDLDKKQICVHTQADMLGFFLQMDEDNFTDENILQNLVMLKERKSLSKDRKSRNEIVEVARSPDMNTINADGTNGGFVKNLFTSRKNRLG